MKSLKLDHELAKLVLSGKKTATWRINDDKDISVNDRVELIDKVDPNDFRTWESIGIATVDHVSEKRLGDIRREDFVGHEHYQSTSQLISTYQGYYGDGVTEETPVKMIHFTFAKREGAINHEPTPKQLPEHVKMFADGGSRGNPGPSASGYVLLSMDNQVLIERGVYLGITTNNQAEYKAVLFGLEDALDRGARTVDAYLDSLLVVNQMNGVFKIKNEELKPIHRAIQDLWPKFDKLTFTHVPRELNKLADAEVNKCLDAEAGII